MRTILSLLPLAACEPPCRTLPVPELLDRVRGGWVGQMVGNVLGLPFEFRYADEPGPLPDVCPNLPRARSDDDTDVEWLHFHLMDRMGTLLVPYPELAREWVRSMNRGIWVANKRARELMEQGIVPPWTSHGALNPHAGYNLSGQFCAEAFGLLAPGLPDAAARIAAHYIRVTVRGEPVQACAFTTALVSLAFFESDTRRLVERALPVLDPASQHAEMVRDVLEWHRLEPADWARTRGYIQRKYRDERGWNMNATVTNGAFVVAALLYGRGDFAETLRIVFALGYDTDCNGATCGAVLGAMHGARALAANAGWVLPEVYENATRDGLPSEESLDRLVVRTARLAERAMLDAGGVLEGDAWLLPAREPALFEPLEPVAGEGARPAAEEAVDQDALQQVESGSPAARAFAAVRLAHHRRGRLDPEARHQVRDALLQAAGDDVLGPMAREALGLMDRDPFPWA